MNKNNSTALNKVKSKLKKYLAEAGESDNTFVDQLAKYRENPENSDGKDEQEAEESNDAESSDDDDGSDDDDSDDSDEPKAKKPVK